jgi:hypothetical protein
MKIFKIVLLLLLSYNGIAQQFTVSAKVKNIGKDGLHSIALTPDFRKHADANLAGIRIEDSNGKEVPYFLSSTGKSRIESRFTKYPMLLKRVATDSVTQIFIEHVSGEKWNEVTLAITNTDAVKTYSISGSNDNTEWFGLVNNQTLSGLYSHADTTVYKTLPMPVNTYKYLKIEFSDKASLPFNITAAGTITGKPITNELQEIRDAHVKITEMILEKKTRVTITFNNPAIIDRMVFDIKAPQLYKRNAAIFVSRSHTRRKKATTYLEQEFAFNLTSSGKNVIDDLNLIENKIVIDIDNKDNEPLEIGSVKLYHTPVSIIADLKSDEKYTVLAGDMTLQEPDYDLKNFKNQIPDVLPQATLSKAEFTTGRAKGINADKSPWIMWACISIGAIILSYFCYSLVRDMKNSENQPHK